MATDFRFNGQASYSPLLNALAQAPYNAAQLRIEQEKNQRARLSDLLTNMSNAAALARHVQVMGATNKLAQQAGGNQTLAGNAAMINPEGYAGGVAGVTAPFQGLDAMMAPAGQAQPQTPSFSNADETPSANASQYQNEAGGDPRRQIIMNKLFPSQYEISVDPNTGMRQMVSKIPGMPVIPIDKGGTPINTGDVQPGQSLNPTQKKEAVDTGAWLTDQVKEFKNNDTYKNALITIDGARRLRALTKANIPLSEINVQAAQTKLAGINRITEIELERSGIDPGVLPKYQQMWSKMNSKGFIQKNKEELNQMADTLEKVQQNNLKDMAGSQLQSMQAVRPDIPLKRHQAVINGAIGQYMKPVKSQQGTQAKGGKVDIGGGFTYTMK